MSTVKEALNIANPTSLPDMARKVTLGDVLAGLIPSVKARTGLASNATQVEPEPGAILAVTDTAGTTAITMVTGTAGAGEVTVSYDADGVATLVFGSGAVTAYNVIKLVLPAGIGATLAADAGTCV